MYLSTSISALPLVGDAYVQKLGKLGISTVDDLLHHIPFRYNDFRIVTPVSRAQIGENVTIHAEVTDFQNIVTKNGKRIQIAKVTDESGELLVLWFNMPFLSRVIYIGESYAFSGKIQFYNKKRALFAPDHEPLSGKDAHIHTGRLVPIYPETRGVTSKWLRSRVNFLLTDHKNDIKEFLPTDILKNYNLFPFYESLLTIHFPDSLENIDSARIRLAFDELLLTHIKSLLRKHEWLKKEVAHKIPLSDDQKNTFMNNIPFTLTMSQTQAIDELYNDISQKNPMNRLLEGDVGSGKTVVAAAGVFAAFVNGFQSVIMAPTQILAEQHYKTLSKLFEPYNVRIDLVTGTEKKTSLGKTDIFIGTHALIQKRVRFENVAFIVIDEQHRFGVNQRTFLTSKAEKRNRSPHVLTMTATPIPRTIALTMYGDLSLSVLNELPKGRQKITTWVVPPEKRVGAYEWIRKEIIENKSQAYIVCPLIDESETETMKEVKAAKSEFDRLKKIFPKLTLGLLHGKQKAKEKTEILHEFSLGKIDILVSTPVVEVGIDVPNATIMMIEGADRFGLAQLHQLRGRVGRGEKKSYCLLFTESQTEKTAKRMEAMKTTHSGFELAELDLSMRGPGDIFGTKQHGVPDLKIARWSDSQLIQDTRLLAEKVVSEPERYPTILSKLHELEISTV